MAKTKKADLWRLVTDYFDVYMKDVRRMSKGTIETYRYGLYSFVSYMSKQRKVEVSLLCLDHFSRDNVKGFIVHLHLVEELADSTCNLNSRLNYH